METLEELKAAFENAHVSANYYAVSGKSKFYFEDVPDIDGCGMWLVGEGGELIETDLDSVCIYGFDELRSMKDIKRIIELMEQVEQICNEEDEGVEM